MLHSSATWRELVWQTCFERLTKSMAALYAHRRTSVPCQTFEVREEMSRATRWHSRLLSCTAAVSAAFLFQLTFYAPRIVVYMLPGRAGPIVMALAVRALRSAHPFLLALWLFAAAAAQAARIDARLDVQVKAAYLYKFAGFVDWPAAAFGKTDSPLVVGVAGNDELAAQLEQVVAGRSVGGHPLAVRRMRRGDSVLGLHVLYGAGQEGAALLAAARGLPLLTVSDAADTPAGMIRFLVLEQRLRFEVALEQVAPSGLKISARLLAAALHVTGAA
jgi:hypothetical protein